MPVAVPPMPASTPSRRPSASSPPCRTWNASGPPSRHHPLLPAGFNTILPGVIVGGPGGGVDGRLDVISNPGTSPNYCAVEYNLWYLPGESFEDVRDEVETFVHAVCQTDPWLRAHPPRFTWKLRNIYFPLPRPRPTTLHSGR